MSEKIILLSQSRTVCYTVNRKLSQSNNSVTADIIVYSWWPVRFSFPSLLITQLMNELITGFISLAWNRQARGCNSPAVARDSFVRNCQSGTHEDDYSTLRGVRAGLILAQVITSRSVPYMAYIAHLVTGTRCRSGGHMRHTCVYYFHIASRVFKPECTYNRRPKPISEGHRPAF